MENTLKLNNWNHTIGVFDFDGNILNTDTPVYFKNKETWEINKFRAHYVDQNPKAFYSKHSLYEEVPETYSESRDFSLNNWSHRWFEWMFDDVKKAVETNNFASSFDAFKDIYLIKSRVFAILTARWNSADNFQRAFTFINENTLNKEEKEEQFENIIKNFGLPYNISYEEAIYHYFWNVINYIPCSNPQIEKIFKFGNLSSSERKAKVIDFLFDYYVWLLEKIYKKNILEILSNWQSISFWFSDDSVRNIVSVYEKMRKILDSWDFYPDISKKFSVFFTWKTEDYYKLVSKLWDEEKFDQIVKECWLKIKLKK